MEMQNQSKIIIYVDVPLSPEIKEYIHDCWTEFVTNDLGYEPHQLMMVSD